MKKYFILTSVLALTACGGGSGSGGGYGDVGVFVPGGDDVVVPSVGIDETIRASNLVVTSNVDNGVKRNKVIENNYSAAGLDVPEMDDIYSGSNAVTPIQNRAAVRGKSHKDFGWDFVDGMYSNMNYWLGENSRKPKTDKEYEQFKHALVMAGYVKDKHGNYLFKDKTLSEIKDVIDQIFAGGLFDDIKEKAESIYEELGTFKQFKIEESEMFFIPEDDGQNRIIFHVNDRDNIDGVAIKQNSESGVVLNVDFDRIDFDSNSYRGGFTSYSYILDNIDQVDGHDYDPEGDEHSIELDGTEILDLAKLKGMFKTEIERAYKNGKFHGYHNYTNQEREEAQKILAEQGVENITGQQIESIASEMAAERMYKSALARVDAWEAESDVLQQTIKHKIDMDIQTFGKEVGLAYSDFGELHMLAKDWLPDEGQTEETAEEEGQETIIYGGYSDKRVEKITNNTTFKGLAAGTVRYEIERNNSDDLLISESMDVKGDATLVVEVAQNGNITETLNAAFSDSMDNKWYDVKMVNAAGGQTISFTDNTLVNGVSGIEEAYTLPGKFVDSTYVVNDFTRGSIIDSNDDGTTGYRQGNFEIQYYGNKQTNPTEAVGYVSYREGEPFTSADAPEAVKNDMLKTVGIEFGFGMQKDFTK